MCALECTHILVFNSFPEPSPLSKILYLPPVGGGGHSGTEWLPIAKGGHVEPQALLLSVRRAGLYTCIYTQRSEPSLSVVAK